jgi:hypothetical protein
MALDYYQLLILGIIIFMNILCGYLIVYTSYAAIAYKELRDSIKEAVQDGDKIFHWKDAKAFGSFVAGCLCAIFTMNLGGAFAMFRMFDLGSISFLSLFVGITFTLWGIAWKK